MVDETSDRPRLTLKGARTRARIVQEAAVLIHERGVAGTTLDDVEKGWRRKSAAPPRCTCQLLPRQGRTRAGGHRIPSRHHRHSPGARAQQRERSRSLAEHGDHRGEASPKQRAARLGSLGGQLAESDPEASRRSSRQGSIKWAVAVIGDALRSLHADGKLPSGIDPDDLATTLLATLARSGFYQLQVQRSTAPVRNLRSTPSSALMSADGARGWVRLQPSLVLAHGISG